LEGGFERRLLASVRWTLATAVARLQPGESVCWMISALHARIADSNNNMHCAVDSCLMRARLHRYLLRNDFLFHEPSIVRRSKHGKGFSEKQSAVLTLVTQCAKIIRLKNAIKWVNMDFSRSFPI